MNEPVAMMSEPGMGFFALIILGGLAGWIAGMALGIRHGIFTNILVGVVGSWLGSEIGALLHYTVRGSLGHFLAALAGSIIVLVIWQAIHGRSPTGNL